MASILVTGADGFVGRTLGDLLESTGHSVSRIGRANSSRCAAAIEDIGEFEDWPRLLEGIEVVIHLAARAHVTRELLAHPLREFRRVNVVPTVRLAQCAVAAGVKRFVFVSSIGVNGVRTTEREFRESDCANPTEPYSQSKWEAEQALVEIGAQTGLEVVRVRPTLVIGSHARGNLLRLMKLVDSGFPMPFGGVDNHRSFIPLQDLCELLMLSATRPEAAGELFLAANPNPISTPDLMRAIAAGLGKRVRIIPVPALCLKFAARLLGLADALVRLESSLQVDASRAHDVLKWKSETSCIESAKTMAQDYARWKATSRA